MNEIKNSRKRKKKIMTTVLALMLLLPAGATATTVSIGEVTVSPGGSLALPIMIIDVTDCGVAAVQFSYDPSVVHVTEVKDSQFDVCDPTINNVTGNFEIPGVQFWSDGLSGDVRLANVILKAVGTEGQRSVLNLTINELKTVGPPSQTILAEAENGMVMITKSTTPSKTGIPTTPTPGTTATPTVTPGATPTPTPAVSPFDTHTPTPGATPTPEEPGFEAVFTIAGLLAIAYLVLRRQR